MEILCCLLLPVLLLYLLSQRSNWSKRTARLPPGPWQLPIIGSMHHLIGAPSPQRRFAELAKRHGPLMHLRIGEISTIVVSSPEMLQEVMKTHDIAFAERPALGALVLLSYGQKDVGLSPYGAYWRQMRKICTLELLSAKRVAAFRAIREAEASRLVGAVYSAGSSPVNVSKMFMAYNMNLISTAAFGRVCRDMEQLVPVVEDVLSMLIGVNLADFFPSYKIVGMLSGFKKRVQRCHQKMDEIFEAIIQDHKERRTATAASEEEEDLVDVLLRLQAEGQLEFPLTMDHIKATIFDMFIGGSDTAAVALEWAMSELIRNPRVMETAQNNVRQALQGKEEVKENDIRKLDYMKLVIMETLRLHPPAPLLGPRVCREKCLIAGYTIPEKSIVRFNAWAMARDPSYWDEPESFRPERFDGSSIDFKGANFNFKYTPFGAGRRICPGIQFAHAAMELPLALLLYHFDWKLPNEMTPEELDMTEAAGSGAPRKSHLCLLATSRSWSSTASKHISKN